jgi:penicillin-binding protein 1C
MTHPIGKRLIRLFKRASLAFLGLIVLSIIAFFAAVRFWPYPADEQLPPVASTWIDDKTGTAIAAFAGSDGNWCQPLRENEISPHLFDAIVAVEDQRFYQHGGVDWQSAASAAWQDLIALRYRRGASTLTMQLVHLRKPAPRSLWVKLQQAIRACQIERTTTKRQIVIEYLNRAPFGGNLNGVGAASWRYFGKRCADLSLGQAALLAGIPQSPLRFRPDRFPAAAKTRRDHVLERMVACGMITEAQRKEATAEPVDASWHPLPQDAPDEIGLLPTLARLARENPGQAIHTTIDLPLQRQATVAVEDQLKLLAASHVSAAAVVVLDNATADCLAVISRVSDRPNDAVDLDLTIRPRSSGSTLKPFIYAAAFDQGIITPASELNDSPTAFEGYEPSNYDRQFAGKISAADALAQSRNIPALVVLSRVRVDRAVEVMRGCGLLGLAKKPERYGLSLAIGGAEVTPMELAEGYATLARGGMHRTITLSTPGLPLQPQALEQFAPPRSGRPEGALFVGADNVPLRGDRYAAERHDVSQSAPAAEAASPVGSSSILRPSSCLHALQCIANLDRTRNVFSPAVDFAPAWKTGTSSGHRDAWCAAVTPRRTVVVWLGNADGSGSDALVGQDAAAPLALRILSMADPSPHLPGFAPPAGFASAPQSPETMQEVRLALVSPVDHQKILHDPSLPNDQQRLALRATAAPVAEQIWWFVDGQSIGSCQSSEVLWWDPVPGSHEIRVVNAAGRAAVAHIEVRGPQE